VNVFLTFAPLLLLPLVYAPILKLAAFLFRRARVRWLHAMVFGAIAVAISVPLLALQHFTAGGTPKYAAMLLSMATQVAVGAWYLAPRAMNAEGAALGYRRAAVLVIVFGVLLLAVSYSIINVLK